MKLKAWGVGVGTTVLVIGAAAAATAATVTVNSITSGTHTVTAQDKAGLYIVIHGPLGDVEWGCDDVSVTASVTAGTGLSNPLAVITSSVWDDCVGPLGLDMNVVQQGNWNLNADNSGTTGTSDNITGDVVASAYVYAKGAEEQCSFTVSGSADATFQENKGGGVQNININETDGTLVLSGITTGVNDCFGLYANGDEFSVVGDFNLTSGGPVYVSP